MQLLVDKRTQKIVEDYVPKGEIMNKLVNFFTVFSDYTRLRIISALTISEMCVSDLSTLLLINQTTLSHQLRLLKNLNAVDSKRQGKVIFYYIKNTAVNDVIEKAVQFLGY